MENFDINAWMPVIVAFVGSAGLWKYLSVKAEQSHKIAIEDKADRAAFNETLKEQVDRLASKVDTLNSEKEELLREMAAMRADLAAATATINHLQETLRNR